MPNEIDTVSDITLTLAQILLNFLFYAFNWKSAGICSFFPLIALTAKRCIFYNEDVATANMVLIGIVGSLWLSTQLVILEIMLTKVGKIFVTADLSLQERHQTLDGLSDGLIIIEEKT